MKFPSRFRSPWACLPQVLAVCLAACSAPTTDNTDPVSALPMQTKSKSAVSGCSQTYGTPGACTTTLTALVADPMRFNGLQVSFKGFLVLDGIVPVVYLTAEHYASYDQMASVELFADFEYLREIFAEHGNQYARVHGVFIAGDSTATTGTRAGRIENFRYGGAVERRDLPDLTTPPLLRLNIESSDPP